MVAEKALKDIFINKRLLEAFIGRRNDHHSPLKNVNCVNVETLIDIVEQSGYSSDAH